MSAVKLSSDARVDLPPGRRLWAENPTILPVEAKRDPEYFSVLLC